MYQNMYRFAFVLKKLRKTKYLASTSSLELTDISNSLLRSGSSSLKTETRKKKTCKRVCHYN